MVQTNTDKLKLQSAGSALEQSLWALSIIRSQMLNLKLPYADFNHRLLKIGRFCGGACHAKDVKNKCDPTLAFKNEKS